MFTLSRKFFQKSMNCYHLVGTEICQTFATAHLDQIVQEEPNSKIGWDDAKPYSCIPGPNILTLLLRSLPGGRFNGLQMADTFKLISDEYGSIVKMPGLFGNSEMIFISDPNDFELVFRNEGDWPYRRGLATFDHYRKDLRPDIYKDMGGLISEQGEKWAKLRTIVNPILLKPSTVNSYIPVVDEITLEFCDQIKASRDNNNELPANFFAQLNSWALESISFIALDHRLNIIGKDREGNANERALSFIQAVDQFLTITFQLEMQPSLWRYLSTPKYKQLMAALDHITQTSLYYIDQAVERLEKNPPPNDPGREPSVFEKLIKIENHAALVMSIDMITAGVDTTSSTTTNFLHHLAKNPDKQEKLREELKNIPVDANGRLKPSSFAKVPYLRASAKESMRLVPIVPGNMRAVAKDVVIKGYQIPQGTNVMMAGILLNRDEKEFKKPNEFIPERWLNEKIPEACPALKGSNPFNHLPFGFGKRACIGRRIAEMEMNIFITRLLQRYRIEYNYGPMKYRTGLIISPVSDLKFKLTEI